MYVCVCVGVCIRMYVRKLDACIYILRGAQLWKHLAARRQQRGDGNWPETAQVLKAIQMSRYRKIISLI